MSVIKREDRRALGRSRAREVPPTNHAQRHTVHSPRGDTEPKRIASPQTLINERAIEPNVSEVVLEWGPNNDPIGRLQAMIDDKTEMPKCIDAPHIPLHNLPDAHRRRPRRADGEQRVEHSDINPWYAKAQWGKPSSNTRRLIHFLNTKRDLLNTGASISRFVEGTGIVGGIETHHPLHPDHDRRRPQFKRAIKHLRNARASTGYVEDGQQLNASTSGTPDQGIRRKHIELWTVPRKIILTMRTCNSGPLYQTYGIRSGFRAHMSTSIHHEEEAKGGEYWDEEEAPEYESESIPHGHLPDDVMSSKTLIYPSRHTGYGPQTK